MANIVCVETSIISYLAARPSRDLVTAGHQQTTHDGGQTSGVESSAVPQRWCLREASAGDPMAAAARLHWLRDISLLTISPEAERLSEALIGLAALPSMAAADALHLATAAVRRADYLLTWNCTHAYPYFEEAYLAWVFSWLCLKNRMGQASSESEYWNLFVAEPLISTFARTGAGVAHKCPGATTWPPCAGHVCGTGAFQFGNRRLRRRGRA